MTTKLSKEQIYEKVSEILVEHFDCPADKLADPNVNLFVDLDLDSIDAVDMVVRLQKMIGEKVNPESFKQIRTLGDVVDAIDKIINKAT